MLVESVSKWPWNECPSQRGIAVQVFVEWVSKCAWNPHSVVEQRQAFLGVTPYQRVSRVDRYEHLVGVVPNNLLAKLAGVSPARIADIRKRKDSKREPS